MPVAETGIQALRWATEGVGFELYTGPFVSRTRTDNPGKSTNLKLKLPSANPYNLAQLCA